MGLVVPGTDYATRKLERAVMDALNEINTSRERTERRFVRAWAVRRHRKLVLKQFLNIQKALVEFAEHADNAEFDALIEHALPFLAAQQAGIVEWLRGQIAAAERAAAERAEAEGDDAS